MADEDVRSGGGGATRGTVHVRLHVSRRTSRVGEGGHRELTKKSRMGGGEGEERGREES